MKDIPVEQRKREKLLAVEAGLSFPEAGIPDLEAIKERFGFSPDQLGTYDTHIDRVMSKNGKVKLKLSRDYDYTETDKIGGLGLHKEIGADYDQN